MKVKRLHAWKYTLEKEYFRQSGSMHMHVGRRSEEREVWEVCEGRVGEEVL